MPITIRSELAMVTGSFLIEKSRILRELSIGLIRMLALGVKTRLYLPKQVISAENQIGNCLYYIQRGQLEVVDNKGQVLTVLSTGRIIGEADLIISRPRPATIRARTHAELLVLDKKEYQSNLEGHQRERDQMKYVSCYCGISNIYKNKVALSILGIMANVRACIFMRKKARRY